MHSSGIWCRRVGFRCCEDSYRLSAVSIFFPPVSIFVSIIFDKSEKHCHPLLASTTAIVWLLLSNILFFFLCDHNCPQGLAPLAECLRLICATTETEAFQCMVLQFLKLLIATSVYSLQFFYLIHSSPVYKCRVLSMLWSLSFLEAMRSILKLFLLLHSSFKAYESVLTSCGDYEVLILCLLVMQSFCLARCVYNGKDKNVSATNHTFFELHTAYLLQFYFCFTFWRISLNFYLWKLSSKAFVCRCLHYSPVTFKIRLLPYVFFF